MTYIPRRIEEVLCDIQEAVHGSIELIVVNLDTWMTSVRTWGVQKNIICRRCESSRSKIQGYKDGLQGVYHLAGR